MTTLIKESVTFVTIDENAGGQRIDNYLMRHLKGVPKSHIYRILRSGEVRVNKGRVDQTHKLAVGDVVRIPPVRVAEKAATPQGARLAALMPRAIYQDDHLLVIDKPAGVAVHGGSGISLGVIEQLRLENPDWKFLELVHRLDRETSGILLLAKKRSALLALHAAIQASETRKTYQALVAGRWQNERQHVRLPLRKFLVGEERRVEVHPDGQAAHTIVSRLAAYADCTLVQAELKTGRTHQIRVHLAHLGFPIVGDDKYAPAEVNRTFAGLGFRRMFLHAAQMSIPHPATGRPLTLEAPLPKELAGPLATLAVVR